MFKLYSCQNLSEVKKDKRIKTELDLLKAKLPVTFDNYSQWTDTMIILSSFDHKFTIHMRVVLDGYACHLSLFDETGDTISSKTLGSDKWEQFKKDMKS